MHNVVRGDFSQSRRMPPLVSVPVDPQDRTLWLSDRGMAFWSGSRWVLLSTGETVTYAEGWGMDGGHVKERGAASRPRHRHRFLEICLLSMLSWAVFGLCCYAVWKGFVLLLDVATVHGRQ